MLVWRAGERIRVVVRPSGTEPELKLYLEVVLPVGEFHDVSAAKESATSDLSCLKTELHVLLESGERVI